MPALLEFLTDLIAAEGGVVEWRGGYERCEALVPEPLQRALGLPEPLVAIEEGELGGQGPAATRIAFGSELLERAMGAAAARGATAAVRAPPPSAAKLVSSGLPRSVSVLNGVSDVAGERPGWRDYWLWSFHTVAEADERQDGVTHACVSSTGAGCTEVGQLLADEVGYLEPFQPDASAWRSAELAALYVAAAARALGQLRLDSEEFCSGVRRRCERDRRRVAAYFADLGHEMDEEIARRALGGEELALRLSKKEQFGAEAERQLETLGEKYRLRLRLQPFALLLAQLPVSICELLVRRRKDERRLEVAYNLLAKRFDPLPCEACGRDTHAFGLCDQALHVLCGPCLDRSGGRGRRDCPRCLGRRPPANVGELIARPPAATQEETGP